MRNNDDRLFADLTILLRQQYGELDAIVDELNQKSVDSVDAIAEQIKQIKQTEKVLLPLRNQFIDSGKQLPDDLQIATDQTIEIVTGLMPKLAQLEKTSADAAKRLFPQVQQGVRAVQMQNAYVGTKR